MPKKRIGIMGGTFDPIHYGHLVTAEAVRHRFQLNQVIFVPSGRPPHKLSHRLTPASERLLLTLLATVPNKDFIVSDWEVQRPQISYTFETVQAFHQQFGDTAELFFITGADAVLEIMQWRRIDELADFCSFIAATRPGYRLDDFEVSPKLAAKLFFMEVPALAISSSDIRRRVAQGEPVKYLLPEEVEMYIYKHGLYKEEAAPAGDAGLADLLAEGEPYAAEYAPEYALVAARLGPHRLAHSLGVANTARQLAERFGLNPGEAYLAGLCHDIAKELPRAEQLALLAQTPLGQDEGVQSHKQLWHAPAGAALLRELEPAYPRLGAAVQGACLWHTLGRPGMTELERLIFVADLIEPGRDFPDLPPIRAAARRDLNAGVLACMEGVIRFLEAENSYVHPLAYEALAYYKQ